MAHLIALLEGEPLYLDDLIAEIEEKRYKIPKSPFIAGFGPEIVHVKVRELRPVNFTFREEIKDQVLRDLNFPGGTLGRGAIFKAFGIPLRLMGLESVELPDDPDLPIGMGCKHVNIWPLGYRRDGERIVNNRVREAL